MRQRNFNSIKVRLEPKANGSTKVTISVFQFHKGTIRTIVFQISCLQISLFQFHKGTIRTSKMKNEVKCINYFNSIKVRLEPAVPAADSRDK